MREIDTNPCRICKTDEHLRPKWASDMGVGWVHCDGCGAHSKPLPVSMGAVRIVSQWNAENPKPEPRP